MADDGVWLSSQPSAKYSKNNFRTDTKLAYLDDTECGKVGGGWWCWLMKFYSTDNCKKKNRITLQNWLKVIHQQQFVLYLFSRLFSMGRVGARRRKKPLARVKKGL